MFIFRHIFLLANGVVSQLFCLFKINAELFHLEEDSKSDVKTCAELFSVSCEF